MDTYIVIYLNLFAFALIATIDAQYTVEILEPPKIGKPRKVVTHCEARGALFGGDVVTFTFGAEAIGCASFVEPSKACGMTATIAKNSTTCENNYAMVQRGNCTFSEKAYRVQESRSTKFKLMIVYADKGDAPIDMSGDKYAEQVQIPALMVSYDCMLDVMHNFPYREGYNLQIRISPGYYDIFRYLVPFIVLVGFCSLVLLVSLIFRLFRERRKIMRKRLSKRNLKKIPTKKFKKGDQPETCAICLDDYIEGEKVRVLPCRHTYHCKCIDPWLTENRKVCPMCKRRVGAPDSDEEAESGGGSAPRPTTLSSSAATPPPSISSSIPSNSNDFYRNTDVVINGPESPSPVILRPSDSQSLRPSTSQQLSEASDDVVITRDDAFLVERDSEGEEEEESNEPPLSQSIKNKIKGFFDRSFNRTSEIMSTGQVNAGYEEMGQGSGDEMEEDNNGGGGGEIDGERHEEHRSEEQAHQPEGTSSERDT